MCVYICIYIYIYRTLKFSLTLKKLSAGPG